jgi:transposase
VICVDEFGPVEIKPIHGHAWRRENHPSRIRATYNRHHGVRHYLSAFDLQANRLVMRCYRRKRWQEFLSFLKQTRARYSGDIRLHVVLDNFSPHRRREVLDWARCHNVRLVFTPTYASWLNRIEPLFAGVRYFALNNSDYVDHEEARRAISSYVAWRNRQPNHPKVARLEKHKLISGTRH